MKDLYRILTLKYLGLSLAQIKSDAALYREPAALQELADEQMDAIEEQFQSLFKRMTTLRSLHDESLDDASVNWEPWPTLSNAAKREPVLLAPYLHPRRRSGFGGGRREPSGAR